MTRLLAPFLFLLLAVPAIAEDAKPNTLTDEEKKAGFVLMFDGKELGDWKPNEKPESWKVIDGAIVTVGERSHMYYMGGENKGVFKNFEFRCQVKQHKNSNAGIYIHAKHIASGWPTEAGYECQICSDTYTDPKKTGSVYNYKNLDKSPVADGEWYDYHIIVKDRTVTIKLNGKTVNEYTEKEDSKSRLNGGYFAFQCHDAKSKIEFRTIRVKAEEKK
jgi:hypothetical protein